MAFGIDIEDLSGEGVEERIALPQGVVGRSKGAVKGGSGRQHSLPGTSSLWLKTFGCSHNTSDAEYMHGQLEQYGYRSARIKAILRRSCLQLK